ncbi:hypothetical protein ACPCUV_36715 [Streptomyces platensis]|uniref:hypothetical protein n=1 Tax=Streptomyces platensis TaxID=58346 RepID=UPI003C2EAF01
MRLRVMVFDKPNSRHSVRHYVHGALGQPRHFGASGEPVDRVRRWFQADERVFGSLVEVRTGPSASTADFFDEVLRATYAAGRSWLPPAVGRQIREETQAEARRQLEKWRTEMPPERAELLARLGGSQGGPYALPGGQGTLRTLRLLDMAGEDLLDAETMAQTGLADGDAVLLHVVRENFRDALMMGVPDPETMFSLLQVAATTERVTASARLWGVLLYTEADTGIATYVRTHFDELNGLTGPQLGILVLERPASWTSARRYWRQTLEPPLFRAFSALRWLAWQPYDKHRCHDIARALHIPPSQLPCLALFRGADTTQRLVFPLQDSSPAAFRRLFGAITEAIGTTGPDEAPAASWWPHQEPSVSGTRPRYRPRHTADPDAAGRQAVETLRALNNGATPHDQLAFEKARAAEERILAALRPRAGRAGQYELRGHNVVLIPHSGGSMTENFTFYGQTTFINRPVDTVIRDFQNSHGSVPHEEDLAALLRAVLAAPLSEADREQAARSVVQVADDLAVPDPDAARNRLATLRATLTGAAGIAQPALDIISRILPLLGS